VVSTLYQLLNCPTNGVYFNFRSFAYKILDAHTLNMIMKIISELIIKILSELAAQKCNNMLRRCGRLLIEDYETEAGLSSETLLKILDNKRGAGLSGLEDR
jgi:hypothetical protein